MNLILFGNMDSNKQFQHILGTDCLYLIDGRYSVDHIIDICYTRLEELRKEYSKNKIEDVATYIKYGKRENGLNWIFKHGKLIRL